MHEAVRTRAEVTPDPVTWGEPLEHLVSRYGVVNSVRRIPSPRGLPGLTMIGAMLGSGLPGTHPGADQTSAGGRALGDPALARALALAEAAERYAAWEPENASYRWSTAAGLPGRAVDGRAFPKCSDEEYAHPGCPVGPFDEDARIRWVRGVDFFTGEEVWVPACTTTYRLPALEPGERFWYRISTGHAVHSDLTAAVLSAVAEVVERDAIALLWLQRLALPRIPLAALGGQARMLVDWCVEHHIEPYLFDATTDVGLPVTYALLRSPNDSSLHTIVACSAGLSTAETAVKALLEAISLRTSLSTAVAPPARYEDFHGVTDGARYMGVMERAAAFDFLLEPRDDRPVFRDRGRYADGPEQALRRLREALSEVGTEVVLVDRTSDELADVGLIAVCAVIPGLQPMSLRPLAQFRAHPRLFSAPTRMGYRSLAPEDLNPLPQPFA